MAFTNVQTLQMKNELEKLVELSLADGYISEKERNVLRKKAEKLGYDADEIDVILDGKLFINSNKNKPKIRKCVSCGEVLTGISKACPACDYINDFTLKIDEDEDVEENVKENDYKGNSWDEDFENINDLLYDFSKAKKIPEDSVGSGIMKILFTGGLYIPYKLLLKKRRLFDQYETANETYLAGMEAEAEKLRRYYGNNPELSAKIDSLLKQAYLIKRGRHVGDIIRLLVILSVWALIIWGIVAIANRPKGPESPEDKTERLINEKKLGEAKAAFAEVTSWYDREKFQPLLTELEIDSLKGAKDYDGALKMANMLEPGYGLTNRESVIDDIVEQQVLELIEEKNFKLAKERVELASSLKQYDLKDKVELAEKLDKKK